MATSPGSFGLLKGRLRGSSSAQGSEPTNTIAELMSKDPLELSAQDIDQLIAYQRKARSSAESGVKVKKADEGPKIDLVALGLIQNPTIKRRKL